MKLTGNDCRIAFGRRLVLQRSFPARDHRMLVTVVVHEASALSAASPMRPAILAGFGQSVVYSPYPLGSTVDILDPGQSDREGLVASVKHEKKTP
jgi:hypothetical protein